MEFGSQEYMLLHARKNIEVYHEICQKFRDVCFHVSWLFAKNSEQNTNIATFAHNYISILVIS
jgi:hypothetical protein